MTRSPRNASSSPRRAEAGGFTLVELMVALAVLAIMVAIAVPSFNTMMHRNRMATASNEIVAALQTARMEAVRRNRRAVLCPSTDGTSCAGDDWLRLMVFVDNDMDATPDADEEVIRFVEASRTGTGITAGGANNRIWFRSDGRVSVGAGNNASIALVSEKLPTSENRRLIEATVSRISVCTTAGNATACPQ